MNWTVKPQICTFFISLFNSVAVTMTPTDTISTQTRDDLRELFIMTTIKTQRRNLTKSRAHYQEAVKHMPLGVSSNFRYSCEERTVFGKTAKGARPSDMVGKKLL